MSRCPAGRDDRGNRSDRGHGRDGQAEHDEVVDRLGLEVRRRKETERGPDRRPARDLDRVPEIRCPVRIQRLPLAPLAAHLDHILIADEALPPDVDARDTALLDDPIAGQLKIFGGLGLLDVASYVVEFDTERVGEQGDRFAEDPGSLLGDRVKIRMVDGMAEAHRYLGRR
jgi:hypothetical protein